LNYRLKSIKDHYINTIVNYIKILLNKDIRQSDMF
jgi:hypothetical protein